MVRERLFELRGLHRLAIRHGDADRLDTVSGAQVLPTFAELAGDQANRLAPGGTLLTSAASSDPVPEQVNGMTAFWVQ